MKEVLYVIAGKRLPVVFHIGARALTSQGLNIHAGHDDVMGVADCGWGMLFARNVQETADLALISRRIAEESETPFFNVQDGFLTTHTIESLRLPEPELMKQFVGDPNGEHRLRNLMDPARPIMSGVVQNQDSYMKGKIAQRYFYDRIPSIMGRVMAEFYSLTGRRYGMTDGYALEDAEYVIVGMGSLVETATATARYLREKEGIKVGTLHVTSFRPFPGAEIVESLEACQSDCGHRANGQSNGAIEPVDCGDQVRVRRCFLGRFRLSEDRPLARDLFRLRWSGQSRYPPGRFLSRRQSYARREAATFLCLGNPARVEP